MDVIPLGPGFAAELRGVTLADVASDEAAYAATRAAFEQHSVLVLRNQEVTDEIQLAFSRRFGPPEVTKVGSEGTGSHFVILSTIGADGKVVPADHRMAMRAKAKTATEGSAEPVRALSDSTIRQTYTVLRAGLDGAVRDGLLGRNPAALIKRPGVERREARHLDGDDVAAVLKAAEEERAHIDPPPRANNWGRGVNRAGWFSS